MLKEEIFLSRVASADDVVRVVADTFGIAPTEVLLVEEPTQIISEADEASVVVHRWVNRGEFPLRLEFWPRRGVPATGAARMAEITKICADLDSVCLAEDDSDVPGQYLEIGPNGPLRTVLLDDDKADDGDYSIEMVIEEPFE